MKKQARIKEAVCQNIEFFDLETLLNDNPGPLRLEGVAKDEQLQMVRSLLGIKRFQATLDLAYLLANPKKPSRHTIRTPRDVHQYCKNNVEIEEDQQTMIISLNTKNVVLNRKSVSPEVMADLSAFKRFVFRHLILSNAASGILVYMRKGGNLIPTADQISVAKRLAEAGEMFGISILDVIHMTNSDFLSFKDKGWV